MCCESLAKCFLVVLNIGFFLLGAVFLAVGILLKVDTDDLLGNFDSIPIVSSLSDLINQGSEYVDDFDSELTELLKNSGWVLIGVGAVIFIVGFLGVCGACSGNKAFLWTYSIIVLIILLAEGALVIFVVIEGDNIEDDVRKVLNRTLQEYEGMEFSDGGFKVPSDPISMAWDVFQVTLKCCGVSNYTDYKDGKWKDAYPQNLTMLFNATEVAVPATCCDTISLSHFPNKLDKVDGEATLECMIYPVDNGVHDQGCYDRVREYMEEYFHVIIGITAGIILIQILAIVSGCFLANRNKEK